MNCKYKTSLILFNFLQLFISPQCWLSQKHTLLNTLYLFTLVVLRFTSNWNAPSRTQTTKNEKKKKWKEKKRIDEKNKLNHFIFACCEHTLTSHIWNVGFMLSYAHKQYIPSSLCCYQLIQLQVIHSTNQFFCLCHSMWTM